MEFGLFTLFDFFPGKQDEHAYYADALDLVIEGEKLGYDSIWVGEEHFYSFGICPSPQMFLTAVAQRTERLRLGTAISLLPFEHPLRKAEDFAMLDVLSGGRLDYGVGRGAIKKHFEGFRIDPEESKPRYAEALEIIKKAWTQDEVTHAGQFWSVDGVSVSPKPVQKPHPPIYRGTVSPEAYAGAAKAGDNAFLAPWLTAPHSEVRKRLDAYRRQAKENNHHDLREASIFLMFCGKDQAATVREGREVASTYARHITSFAKGRKLMGEGRGIASSKGNSDPKSSLFSQADFILSIEDHIEERAIVGTPKNCIRRLEELDDELGLDQVLVYFMAGAWEVPNARRSLTLFGEEVLPHFKQAAA